MRASRSGNSGAHRREGWVANGKNVRRPGHVEGQCVAFANRVVGSRGENASCESRALLLLRCFYAVLYGFRPVLNLKSGRVPPRMLAQKYCGGLETMVTSMLKYTVRGAIEDF